MKYQTQTEFRKVLKVSKSTMSRYVHRWDWPVRRNPPWSRADLIAVNRWREGLQENRADPQSYGDDAEFEAWCRQEYPELFDEEKNKALMDYLYGDGELPV